MKHWLLRGRVLIDVLQDSCSISVRAAGCMHTPACWACCHVNNHHEVQRSSAVRACAEVCVQSAQQQRALHPVVIIDVKLRAAACRGAYTSVKYEDAPASCLRKSPWRLIKRKQKAKKICRQLLYKQCSSSNIDSDLKSLSAQPTYNCTVGGVSLVLQGAGQEEGQELQG